MHDPSQVYPLPQIIVKRLPHGILVFTEDGHHVFTQELFGTCISNHLILSPKLSGVQVRREAGCLRVSGRQRPVL
jgi:hypothetical protein